MRGGPLSGPFHGAGGASVLAAAAPQPSHLA